MTIKNIQSLFLTPPPAAYPLNSLPGLPIDLLPLLFKHLKDGDIASIQQTCTQIHTTLTNDTFWKSRLCSLFSRTIPQQKNYQSTYKQFCYNLEKGKFTVSELQGHGNDVLCLSIINNHTFASGSKDLTIKIWDLTSHNCLATLEGHQGIVSCLATHPNYFFSGSSDTTIKIWNPKNYQCIGTLQGHRKKITSLAIYRNLLVSGSLDDTIKIWNLETQNCMFSLKGHTGGISFLAIYGNMLLSGSWDKTIKIWSLDTEELVATLNGHQHHVSCLCVRGNQLFSGSWDKTIKIWNLETRTCIATLNNHAPDYFEENEEKIIHGLHYSHLGETELIKPPTGEVTALQFLHDKLICGTQGQRIYVWDVKNQKCLYTVGIKTEINRPSLTGAVSCFIFRDGKLFSAISHMSNDSPHTILVWDFLSAVLNQNAIENQIKK